MAPVAGFYGKLPSRGDFVRANLPGSCVAAWDGWLQSVFGAARARLGASWDAAWLEAPVWRFALPPGQCGPDPVLGVWMPSVDAAGRHFPLMFAALPATADTPGADAWLDAAEAAGREALASDLSPAALSAVLAAPPAPAAIAEPILARWWSEGSPLVPPATLTLAALPDAATFAAMVRAPDTAADAT